MPIDKNVIGQNIRELREERGLAQEDLALAAKICQSTLSLIERGKTNSRRHTKQKLADALGVELSQITSSHHSERCRLHPSNEDAPRPSVSQNSLLLPESAAYAEQSNLASLASLMMLIANGEDTVKRRHFVQLPPVATAGAILGSRESAAHLVDTDYLYQIAELFHLGYRSKGGDLGRSAVIGQLNDVAEMIAANQGKKIETELHRIFLLLSELIGTISYDTEEYKHYAQGYYDIALRSSRYIGDQNMEAYVLVSMSRMEVFENRPQKAIDILDQASASDPRMLALICARRSLARAAMGEADLARADMAEARDAYEKAVQQAPFWLRYFDNSELSGNAGAGQRDLARLDARRYAEQASDTLRDALSQRDAIYVRCHAIDLANLAECRFLLGDIEAGVSYTERMVALSNQTGSALLKKTVKAILPHLSLNKDKPGVAQMNDELKRVVRNVA